MNGCVNPESEATRQSTFGTPAARRRGNILQDHQQELQLFSRRWLQGLFAFLFISTCFFWIRRIDLLAPLAESTRQLLGCPPPPALTSLALAVYLFSTVVLLLDRTAGGSRPSLKWRHLVCRSVFFFFYAVANALDEYFIFVFVAGLVVIGLELLNIYAYSMKTLPGGKEMVGKL
jgi:hypothetical protein